MKDWLQENPNGSKDAFEKYFKALSADVKKVSQSLPSLLLLIILCTQMYKNQANVAVRISVLHV